MPVSIKECYLDNSATTKPCKKAIENMLFALENCWGNPSSLHDKGIEADELLLKARRAVAKALSADEKEIFFTSSGTEGNNLAIFGAAYGNKRKGNRVITTSVEHPSVGKAFDRLESEGFEVIRLNPDESGTIKEEDLFESINKNTILVSLCTILSSFSIVLIS
jgi:cysteine desulfurase